MPSICWLRTLVFMVVAFPVFVMAEPLPGSATKSVVAAGFGFQDEESSFITVKTYDAQSGEVLSADTYDLDIKDDGPPSTQPRARIFAGGVGVGQGSLSQFTLRVYDASNGRFLWEGHLNLTAGDHPEAATRRVVARVQPRSAVTRITSLTTQAGQPYFVLRALNPQTGQLVWSDEFSTQAAPARVERISRSVVGMAGAAPRDIDFRIKMPDEAGRGLLWEDKVEPTDDNDGSAPEDSDEATGLFRRDRQPTSPSCALRAVAPSSGIETDRRTVIVELESPPPGFAFS